nr:hypothetical protein [Sphingomonas sp. CDS-1]
MTSKPSTDGLTFTHDCYGQPVRIFMWENCPWFEASAICAAMGIDPAFAERFNHKALDTDIAQYPFDAEPVYVLSPIGVWKLVEEVDSYRQAKVARWAKSEAEELVSEPIPDDPRLFVTLTPEGLLPPYPGKFTGRRAAWKALRHSDAGMAAWARERSVIRQAGLRLANPQHFAAIGEGR